MKIQLQQLSKSFGEKVAVDIPQLEIGDGEIIGLVGNNGAGKTTLFRLLLDLLWADSGLVLLTPQGGPTTRTSASALSSQTSQPSLLSQSAAHYDVSQEIINPAKSEEWKKMTGAFIDDTFLIDFLSVEEYFDFIIKVQGLPPMDWNASDDLLVQGFKEFAEGQIFDQKKLIREYSAGNKQKIGIMAAMISRPELSTNRSTSWTLPDRTSSKNSCLPIIARRVPQSSSAVTISSILSMFPTASFC